MFGVRRDAWHVNVAGVVVTRVGLARSRIHSFHLYCGRTSAQPSGQLGHLGAFLHAF